MAYLAAYQRYYHDITVDCVKSYISSRLNWSYEVQI